MPGKEKGNGRRTLAGKVTLVIGGGKDVGKAISQAFAREGANVALTAAPDDDGEAVAKEIKGMGRKSLQLHVNISLKDQVEGAVKRAVETFGRVDILVNSADVLAPLPLLQCTDEEWEGTVSTNLRAAFWSTRAALPKMMRQRWGRIINISPCAGEEELHPDGANLTSAYALMGFTRAVSLEVATHGITANIICPGWIGRENPMIHTDETDNGPDAKHEGAIEKLILHREWRAVIIGEIVSLALFLASDAAQGITGQTIPIN